MKTLVLGASDNPERYAWKAAELLHSKGHEVIAVGIKKAFTAAQIQIQTELKAWEQIDTITLYLSKENQKPYYDFILNSIQPHRVIFNPGTENPELIQLLKTKVPQCRIEIACTLVMLQIGNY